MLRELPRPLRAVYEAGLTGCGLVRRARVEGIEMAVCSPGYIERRPGDRIKTDKRDAIRLARLLLVHSGRLMLGLRGAPNRAPALPRPHSGRLQTKRRKGPTCATRPGSYPPTSNPPRRYRLWPNCTSGT